MYKVAGGFTAALVVAHGSLGIASAAPQPNGLEGELQAGEVVTIRGSGFGSTGPDVRLFEDFEGSSPGSAVTGSGPYIGSWDGLSNDPVIVGEGRSGGGALDAYNGERQRMLTLQFGSKQREIFVSYWVRIPPGSRFPGDTSGTGRFSNDSSWKMMWLMNTTDGHQNNGLFDLCLPTHTGGGTFQLSGNSFKVADRYISNDWFSWNNWMRVSTWIRSPLEKSPGGRFEVVSADRGHFVNNFDAPSNEVSYSNQIFDVMNIPGWIRTDGGSQVRPQYDDIYVATGAGAAARVELANDSSYSRATRVELLLVESWSGSEVRARLPRSVDLDGESWYVFVTDGNGSRNNTGVKADCTDCSQRPKPPALSLN